MLVRLDKLIAHPKNANVMPGPALKKLAEHIRTTGRYPALIVRPHPSQPDHYEILDGHHRADALRSVGRTHARCDVWEVDDDAAAMYLLTLNRLRGEDDPHCRADLLEHVRRHMPEKDLLARIPETADRLRALLRLREPVRPPDPQAASQIRDAPVPVTFFLTPAQHDRLFARLGAIGMSDRSAALVDLLELDS